ncbi:hypothetical protein GB937_007620 [Aspergillus fischeri]|nr:hypothetical protein GB937_007620 [Aspergillus fischeri]
MATVSLWLTTLCSSIGVYDTSIALIVIPPRLTLEHLQRYLVDLHAMVYTPKEFIAVDAAAHVSKSSTRERCTPLYLTFIQAVASSAGDGVASGMASNIVEEGMARPGGDVWIS